MANHKTSNGTLVQTPTSKPSYGTPATATIGGNRVSGTIGSGNTFVPKR